MTAIPCKRPAVPVVVNKGTAVAYCRVPGCDWEYGPGVKTDVEQNATRHRGEHRNAVPETSIAPATASPGLEALCECGQSWLAPTKAHARTWLRHHLTLDHGLVECA